MTLSTTQSLPSVCEALLKIESEFDVFQVNFRGIHVWPVIRYQLKLWAFPQMLATLCPDIGESEDWKKPHEVTSRNILKGIASHPNPIHSLFEDFPGIRSVDWKETLRWRKGDEPPPSLMLYVRQDDYTEQVNGALYGKLIDSFIALASREVNGEHRSIKVEFSNPEWNNLKRHYPSVFLPTPSEMRIRPPDDGARVEGLAELNEVLARYNLKTFDEGGLRKDMEEIFVYCGIFRSALQRFKPRAVVTVSFPENPGFGLALACSLTQIPLVDLFHGRAGPYNPPYTHYSRVPEGGYQLLPSYYWCWGELHKKDMLAHRGKPDVKPCPVIGGNPWASLWKHGSGFPVPEEDANAFEKRIFGKTAVLVALTARKEYLINEMMLSTMEKASSDILWLVRMHPLEFGRIGEVKKLLNSRNISNFEVDLTTKLPLFHVLQRVRACVTLFSSTTLENTFWKVPTLLLNEYGAIVYEDSIDEGLISLAKSPEEAADWLANIPDTSGIKPSGWFITPSPDSVKNALEQILNR